MSSWSPVKGGIPQDSALGPLLFLVYINEMPSLVTRSRLLQFADVICSGKTHEVVKKRLSDDLQRLQAWIISSRMKVNVNKSSVMWFTRKRVSSVAPPTILIDDHQ